MGFLGLRLSVLLGRRSFGHSQLFFELVRFEGGFGDDFLFGRLAEMRGEKLFLFMILS